MKKFAIRTLAVITVALAALFNAVPSSGTAPEPDAPDSQPVATWKIVGEKKSAGGDVTVQEKVPAADQEELLPAIPVTAATYHTDDPDRRPGMRIVGKETASGNSAMWRSK